MKLSWSFRRKLVYSGTTFVLAVALTTFVWLEFFHAAPTCFDNKQNGSETGVDCGGSCALVCKGVAQPPSVQWARVFQDGSSGTYTAVAYVQNNNPGGSAHAVHYYFQFYDANNKLINEQDGVADIPPVKVVPIVVPSIDVGARTIAHVQFFFDDTYPIVWNVIPPTQIPSIHATGQQLSTSGTRLSATLENDSVFDAQRVEAVAILYDQAGVARAASTSLVPLIPHKSSTSVVFTWPQSNPNIAQTEITILPSF